MEVLSIVLYWKRCSHTYGVSRCLRCRG